MSFIKNGWYCAAFASEVTQKPMMRRILGLPVMMVRDSSGDVRAMNDRCPHRFAPLHMGERVGDTIECPYHGLRFDFSGRCVFNPHGDGKIVAAAKVPAFPVVETGPFVWLWPGDPALADPATIPELNLIDIGDVAPVAGHLEMSVDYQLVLDNLLDLSHAGFLHAGTLSPPRTGDGPKPKRTIETEVGEQSVMVRAKMVNVPTPSSQAMYYDGERGDFHSHMEWTLPGTMRHALSMTPVDAGFGNGVQTRLVHLITPAGKNATHYFWMHTRDARMDDEEINQKTRALIEYAFTKEDEPMIAACQDYIGGADFFSLQPLYLETDLAATRCRRIVEKVIKAEQTDGQAASVLVSHVA